MVDINIVIVSHLTEQQSSRYYSLCCHFFLTVPDLKYQNFLEMNLNNNFNIT